MQDFCAYFLLFISCSVFSEIFLPLLDSLCHMLSDDVFSIACGCAAGELIFDPCE